MKVGSYLIGRVAALLGEDGVKGRVLRGSGLTVISFGASNLMRLGSNLVLTRILFPEAFGLMAIVQVMLSGLQMLSDVGINNSIVQSNRGDDEEFLNTAWTLQILRGVVLWLFCCLLAWPVAWLYDIPILATIMPVAGLQLLFKGLQPTRVYTAYRHLKLGRQVSLDLLSQFMGIMILVVFAIWLQSVWALIVGNIVTVVLSVWLYHRFLPGTHNRLRLERSAVREIFTFGRFIFLSTLTSFALNQSDRAILGAFISLAALGVYSIGHALGTLPMMFARLISGRVVFPVYRMRHPLDSDDNRRKIFWLRRLMILAGLGASVVLAFAGPGLVGLLYDDRYLGAGAVISLMAFSSVPMIVVEGSTYSAMAKGDSRSVFLVNLATAVAQVCSLYFGARYYGVFGAVLALGFAPIATYPLRALILQRYRSWDPLGELSLMTVGFLLTGLAGWVHRDAILQLMP